MKKVKLFIIMLAVGLVLAPQAHAQKLEKVAFVDLSRLFDEYYKTKDYDVTLEEKQKGFESERNAKIEKIREAQGRLGLLQEDEKARLEEEIETLKADLLEYDRQKKTDLTKERNEKIREILLEIEKVVSDYAEKEKYSMIFNDRVLIFGNETFNITESVLKILNAGQKE